MEEDYLTTIQNKVFGKAIRRMFVGVSVMAMLSVASLETVQVEAAEVSQTTLLNDQVQSYQQTMIDECNAQGLDLKYVPTLLALMMQESGGRGEDPMQASESINGQLGNIHDGATSIHYGVKNFKERLQMLNDAGFTDLRILFQSYNYGAGFISWMQKQGATEWTVDLSERYSLEVLKPTMEQGGWSGVGEKSEYVNEVSLAHGKPYYYISCGNFHYGDEVARYYRTVGDEYTNADISEEEIAAQQEAAAKAEAEKAAADKAAKEKADAAAKAKELEKAAMAVEAKGINEAKTASSTKESAETSSSTTASSENTEGSTDTNILEDARDTVVDGFENILKPAVQNSKGVNYITNAVKEG